MRRLLLVTGLVSLPLLACSRALWPSAERDLAHGTIERERVQLLADASEPIVELLVREGEPVFAGQMLMRLEDELLRTSLAGAEALLAERCARLAELLREPRGDALAEAKALLAAAEADSTSARRELERMEQLVADAREAPEALDAPRALAEAADARRMARTMGLMELERGPRPEVLAQALASMACAEAEVRRLQVRLERLVLRAPCRGRVESLPFQLGERPPQLAPVAVLEVEGPPHVRAWIPAALRARVGPGTAALVQVEGCDEPWAGWVRSVSGDPLFAPEGDRQRRLGYALVVDLPEEAASSLPTGLPATVRFPPLPPAVGEQNRP